MLKSQLISIFREQFSFSKVKIFDICKCFIFQNQHVINLQIHDSKTFFIDV